MSLDLEFGYFFYMRFVLMYLHHGHYIGIQSGATIVARNRVLLNLPDKERPTMS